MSRLVLRSGARQNAEIWTSGRRGRGGPASVSATLAISDPAGASASVRTLLRVDRAAAGTCESTPSNYGRHMAATLVVTMVEAPLSAAAPRWTSTPAISEVLYHRRRERLPTATPAAVAGYRSVDCLADADTRPLPNRLCGFLLKVSLNRNAVRAA